jgi:hypothetical protein
MGSGMGRNRKIRPPPLLPGWGSLPLPSVLLSTLFGFRLTLEQMRPRRRTLPFMHLPAVPIAEPFELCGLHAFSHRGSFSARQA